MGGTAPHTTGGVLPLFIIIGSTSSPNWGNMQDCNDLEQSMGPKHHISKLSSALLWSPDVVLAMLPERTVVFFLQGQFLGN